MNRIFIQALKIMTKMATSTIAKKKRKKENNFNVAIIVNCVVASWRWMNEMTIECHASL